MPHAIDRNVFWLLFCDVASTDLKVIEVEKVFYRCMISAFLLVGWWREHEMIESSVALVENDDESFGVVWAQNFLAYENLFSDRKFLKSPSTLNDEGCMGEKWLSQEDI